MQLAEVGIGALSHSQPGLGAYHPSVADTASQQLLLESLLLAPPSSPGALPAPPSAPHPSLGLPQLSPAATLADCPPHPSLRAAQDLVTQPALAAMAAGSAPLLATSELGRVHLSASALQQLQAALGDPPPTSQPPAPRPPPAPPPPRAVSLAWPPSAHCPACCCPAAPRRLPCCREQLKDQRPAAGLGAGSAAATAGQAAAPGHGDDRQGVAVQGQQEAVQGPSTPASSSQQAPGSSSSSPKGGQGAGVRGLLNRLLKRTPPGQAAPTPPPADPASPPPPAQQVEPPPPRSSRSSQGLRVTVSSSGGAEVSLLTPGAQQPGGALPEPQPAAAGVGAGPVSRSIEEAVARHGLPPAVALALHQAVRQRRVPGALAEVDLLLHRALQEDFGVSREVVLQVLRNRPGVLRLPSPLLRERAAELSRLLGCGATVCTPRVARAKQGAGIGRTLGLAPELWARSPEYTRTHLQQLGALLDLPPPQLQELVLRCPVLLLCAPTSLEAKVQGLAQLLAQGGFSRQQAVSMVLDCPSLLCLHRGRLATKFSTLASLLGISAAEMAAMALATPRLLTSATASVQLSWQELRESTRLSERGVGGQQLQQGGEGDLGVGKLGSLASLAAGGEGEAQGLSAATRVALVLTSSSKKARLRYLTREQQQEALSLSKIMGMTAVEFTARFPGFKAYCQQEQGRAARQAGRGDLSGRATLRGVSSLNGDARRTAHRVMAKKRRKGSDKKHKVSRSAQGKQRQDRRDGWTTRRRQPAPAQPDSMECDTDPDSESDCDYDPEPQSDSESEPESEPEPVAQPPQRRCSARLAAMAPAAPTGPPLPLDCEDPLMLRQLKDFCMFFVNPNFKTCYNQLQRRHVRNRHPMLMPAFEDPSHQALVAKLQELGSIYLAERIVKLYAKAARAKLGWSGEEAQLFIRMACGYGINAHSSELKAATLDKGHVADLIEEANTHRRLLGMKKEGSLQDTLPLPCRMRHAVHVCRWLERWQQPHTPPPPGQPKRGKRRGVGPRTLTCPPPFTLTPMARVGVHFIKVDSRVLHGVCKQLGLTKEPRAAFTSQPALSDHWARWFNTNKLRNKEFHFERLVDTDGVSVCVHYTRPLPPPPAPPPAASSSSTSSRPSAAAAAAHAVGLPHIGRGIAEMHEFVFDTDTQIGVGIDPGVTQAVSAASGVWDPATGQLKADQLRRWKLTKGEVKHASGLNSARRDTERWLAPIKPHLRHLAAASSAGTSLVANLKHVTVTLATWNAVWEVYLDPKWTWQRLRLYGAQDRALEQFFNKLEREMAELSMKRHNRAKQLVVFFGAATIGTGGGWGADAVLRACRKVVCRPRGKGQDGGRVVLVDEHRTSRVSLAVNGKQPCEVELNTLSATRPAGWKPPAGQVEQRLVRPAWSQERGQPVRGQMWCPVVAPRRPPQAPRSGQAATQPAASEPGPSTPQPAKRTKAEPGAAEPTQPTKAQGKAAKAKRAPRPGRWLDRDCNAALNMQRIGESRWRPLELCYWPDQGALPAKGKEYPGLGYKRLRDKPPKAQEQQQPAVA
ncbi:hypothetical protein QJQ45_029926, partial [Haematococcus lacustris]